MNWLKEMAGLRQQLKQLKKQIDLQVYGNKLPENCRQFENSSLYDPLKTFFLNNRNVDQEQYFYQIIVLSIWYTYLKHKIILNHIKKSTVYI